jgi:hypothetical protein
MAGKVFFSVSMSLDGFIAPEAAPVEDVFSPEPVRAEPTQRVTHLTYSSDRRQQA